MKDRKNTNEININDRVSFSGVIVGLDEIEKIVTLLIYDVDPNVEPTLLNVNSYEVNKN